MASSQMSSPTKGSLVGDGTSSNMKSSGRSNLTVRFEMDSPSDSSAATTSTESDESASTGSLTSSGHSLLQHDCSHAATLSGGPVHMQSLQVTQTPNTPQRARGLTTGGNSTTSVTSPFPAFVQTPRKYGDSPQKMNGNKPGQLRGFDTSRRNSHASQTSDNWRSPRHPSYSSSRRSSIMLNPSDASRTPSLNSIPEYLAVQEMAFRQGQHSQNGSRNRIPPSPFAEHFDDVWEEYYRLGAASGTAPVTSPAAASSPSHDNYTWAVLINPATQDLEHPNGTLDLEWTYKMCVMSLNCMRELICVVCRRINEWRKIVCDIPAPAKQAILAFPDLCAYYETLQRDAHEALNGQTPMGYEGRS